MNRKGATSRESVLAVIRGWFSEHPYSPSLPEIAARHTPIVSKVAIYRRVKQLEKEGLVIVEPKKQRGISLLDG